ncbi:transcription termination/antitermination protein NusA [Thermaerobacter sp. PB12/4term]|uniref:transcription termination factor NusA n=1 Tax=Thermaerobacter sp. PB12/4term TaxID=2293838 RepID=UPI000E32A3EB|nr:transcription termination factor NusA [Thermaerobacter sp. PB12/4term]QIA26967.1 transcription termination/antitermination protein NusA [Thermaerobacter sp. PB12/4term]
MNAEFIEALEDLERQKGIDKDTLLEAIEAALVAAFRRHFGTAQNVAVRIDRETGEIRVVARRDVVEEVEDPSTQISVAEAREIDPRYKPGDVVEQEVTPRDFGRIAAQTAKQVVLQRIREAERDLIYEEFIAREGDIVTGVVQRVQGRNVFVDLGRTETVLFPSEQIPGERYRPGDRIKVYIVEVRKTPKGPQILISRSHPNLIKRLFELEVPEIHDGIVEIKEAVREPGVRAKVAVDTRDERVDPVGACVGPRGARVQAVVAELRGERIDVIRWADEPEQFVANALSPAKVTRVILEPETRVARVIVPDHQLSLAIGKEGQNARLAARLTGWKIDIHAESQAAEWLAREDDWDIDAVLAGAGGEGQEGAGDDDLDELFGAGAFGDAGDGGGAGGENWDWWSGEGGRGDDHGAGAAEEWAGEDGSGGWDETGDGGDGRWEEGDGAAGGWDGEGPAQDQDGSPRAETPGPESR